MIQQNSLRALVLLACAVVPPAAVADPSLIARFSASGNARDSTGVHHGRLKNGANFADGRIGQAFQLNGLNQYVSVSDSPAWTFGADDFSIALFANFSSIRQDTLGNIPNVFIGHDDGGGIRDKWIFFYDGNGRLSFHINGPGLEFLLPGTKIRPRVDQWHHYALTRSGTAYNFYYDGSLLGTATSSLVIPDASAPLTIGQSEKYGFINGRLDEVRLYDRALSASEIGSLATAVPEEGTLRLLALGLLALSWHLRGRRPGG